MSTEIKRVVVTSRRPLRAGEWACVDAKCAHINAEKRTSCEICGKGKPRSKNRVGREIGKDAADKSKGLFSADDWVCTKCGNVNWARRSVCNVCNAPKLADLEVRTGYGGGYMDRQDVEYIERDDDDEEFDEFGRKKKRRNKDNKSKSVEEDENDEQEERELSAEHVKNTEDDIDNEDEEEEEESDDGDLDKYDLTADPELLSFKIDPAKLLANSTANEDGKEPDSDASSDCSCSCSGGECSCVESEDESLWKKARLDEERRRSVERTKSDGGGKEPAGSSSNRAERRGDSADDHKSHSHSVGCGDRRREDASSRDAKSRGDHRARSPTHGASGSGGSGSRSRGGRERSRERERHHRSSRERVDHHRSEYR